MREERLPLGEGVELLNLDANGLLAFFKPAGVMSHPNAAKDVSRSLLRVPYDLERECYEAGNGGEARAVWLLNRLDSATSGVLLCAADAEVAEVVRGQFARGQVRKKYYALVFGAMNPGKQVWRDRLEVSKKGGQIRTSARGGLAAEAEAVLKKHYPGRIPVSLLELYPGTGRTHQLRVQCASRSLPIVGDETYGNFGWNREFAKATGRKRLFLHSAEVSLRYRLAGREFSFGARAALPGEFSPGR